MKKRKSLMLIIIILIALLLNPITITIIYFRYEIIKNSKNKLIRVPISVVEILPNEKITADLIGYYNIKKVDKPDNIYTDIDEIIGKCVKDNTYIEDNGYFKKDDLVECNNQ